MNGRKSLGFEPGPGNKQLIAKLELHCAGTDRSQCHGNISLAGKMA
jgi:hypothetical protein